MCCLVVKTHHKTRTGNSVGSVMYVISLFFVVHVWIFFLLQVDLSGRSNGQPRQMMVLQPQQSTGRVSPSPMRTVSVETPPSRPIPTPR